MSDKVASVVAIAPVAAPGRGNPFVQAGSGGSNQNPKNQPQEAVPQAPVRRQDVVSLQSLEVEQAQSTSVRPPTQSASQAESKAALQAAEATAQAQAEAQSEQQNQNSLQHVANTLSGYFSEVHPDVNFRVEQQASGMVVLMVNSTDGKVLQTISGDEARQLASSLFGTASLMPVTA